MQEPLLDIIDARLSAASSSEIWTHDFLGRLRQYATGGKALRGGLVCFSYEIFSHRPLTAIVKSAALSLELCHSALLIHDDVMDEDEMRRGQPSMHIQYQQLGESHQLDRPKNFGANMALCGGDMVLFMAFGLLHEIGTNTPENRAVHQLFAQYLQRVCDGQMQDIYLDAVPGVPTKAAIFRLMNAKTATYSFSLPLAAGAALAGQPPRIINKLERFGQLAGIVYQIRDDELNLFGSTDILGKPIGSDIREGKKTLLYYYLMKRSSPAQRRQIQPLFGNPKLQAADVNLIRRLAIQLEVQKRLAADILPLKNRALKLVDQLPIDSPAKTELRQLLDFCADRQH